MSRQHKIEALRIGIEWFFEGNLRKDEVIKIANRLSICMSRLLKEIVHVFNIMYDKYELQIYIERRKVWNV